MCTKNKSKHLRRPLICDSVFPLEQPFLRSSHQGILGAGIRFMQQCVTSFLYLSIPSSFPLQLSALCVSVRQQRRHDAAAAAAGLSCGGGRRPLAERQNTVGRCPLPALLWRAKLFSRRSQRQLSSRLFTCCRVTVGHCFLFAGVCVRGREISS